LSLLLGDSTVLTPMMLLDLADVVSSIITNYNIFHFENPRLDSIAFYELLGNQPIFIPIPVRPDGSAAVGSLTIGHWRQSRFYLRRVSKQQPNFREDARAIRDAWQAILGPGSSWTNWSKDTEEFVRRRYGEESDPLASFWSGGYRRHPECRGFRAYGRGRARSLGCIAITVTRSSRCFLISSRYEAAYLLEAGR